MGFFSLGLEKLLLGSILADIGEKLLREHTKSSRGKLSREEADEIGVDLMRAAKSGDKSQFGKIVDSFASTASREQRQRLWEISGGIGQY